MTATRFARWRSFFIDRSLPAVDIRLPFLVLIQMPAKDVHGACRWLIGNTEQFHMHLLHFASTFAVITMRACCHYIRPNVLPTHMTRHDVVYCQAALPLSAILAGIIIAAKNFAAGQLDVWARPMNLVLQPNDRR